MKLLPSETAALHTRLLKCALEVEASRAWWAHSSPADPGSAQRAFDEYWFGARSLERVEVLVTNMRARYNAYPTALELLHRWPQMSAETRRLICHWHLQLSDPLYRSFTGDYLVQRREGSRPELGRDLVVAWVGQQGKGSWTMPTRVQFASKLLSAAHTAGLLGSSRDPRTLTLPRVPDQALEYVLHLLRETRSEGSLLANPYLGSLGLSGSTLEERLRALPSIRFHRQSDLLDLGWRYSSLGEWGEAQFPPAAP